jgi:membrane-bound serine protease (ClpP class)
VVLTADGIVNPVMARYLDRGISAAERADAAAVIIQLDTPGGLLTSTRDIVSRIERSSVPVVIYVAPTGAQAASAGTFITLAGHVAAMAPGTNIGAASPVDISGGDIEGTMGDKAVNDAAAFIRSIAEQRGRNADWAERAVRESVAVPASEALSLNVIDLIAPSRHALLTDLDGRTVTLDGALVTLRTADAPVRDATPSFADRVLNLLSDPNIAFLLLSLAGLAIMLELYNPGSIVPGVFGVVALVLGLFALGTLPANWAALILIGLAFVLFAAEVMVTGFGLLATAGGISLALGGLFLVDGEGPMPRVSLWLAVGTAVAFTGFFAFAMTKIRQSRTRPAGRIGAGSMTGKEAVAVTPLDPDGYVLVEGERWAAQTAGGPVAVGERVTITRQEGLHLRVVPVSSMMSSGPAFPASGAGDDGSTRNLEPRG